MNLLEMKQLDLKTIGSEVRKTFDIWSLKAIKAKYAFVIVALAEGHTTEDIAKYLKTNSGDFIPVLFDSKKLFDLDMEFRNKVKELL